MAKTKILRINTLCESVYFFASPVLKYRLTPFIEHARIYKFCIRSYCVTICSTPERSVATTAGISLLI